MKGPDGTRRKLGKFEVLGRWMGRYGAWQNGMADQLFVGDHSVLDCSKVTWNEGTGAYVAKDEHPGEDSCDLDWFDASESLPMDAKIEMVEEMVVKMEGDDEGWNSEDEVEEYAEGDDEILAQGKALLAVGSNSLTPRTPRARRQNQNHGGM